jgi:hypothetical protein
MIEKKKDGHDVRALYAYKRAKLAFSFSYFFSQSSGNHLSFLVTNLILTKYTKFIYLSMYIYRYIYVYLFILMKSISFFFLFARQCTRCMISFCVCVFYVLSIIHQHTHKTKLLMIKVCIWVVKTIEASQMKHIYTRR